MCSFNDLMKIESSNHARRLSAMSRFRVSLSRKPPDTEYPLRLNHVNWTIFTQTKANKA